MYWQERLQQSDDSCIKALRNDSPEELARELDAGRAVDERFHYDRTFLHIAAELGATKCAAVLLAKGATLEAHDKNGRSPLSYAVGHGHTHVARLLIKRGAQLSVTIPPATDERRKELEQTFRQLTEKTAEDAAKLVPFIAEEMSTQEFREEMLTSMVETLSQEHTHHVLDDCNDFETLKLLIDECGSDPNRHDGAGECPLKRFAAANHPEAIAFLLGKGARVDFTSTGDTALHAAVAADSIECARLLLEAGANPNQQDVDGQVPMSSLGSQAMLDLLLSFGADPNIGDQCDFKPSYWVDDQSLKERLLKLERRNPEEEAQFKPGSGELADFILEHARKRGAKVLAQEHFPGVTSEWKFFEDADGVVIEAAPATFPKVESLFREAFGEPKQRSEGTKDGGTSGYYAGKQFGPFISFAVNVLRTQITIIGKARKSS